MKHTQDLWEENYKILMKSKNYKRREKHVHGWKDSYGQDVSSSRRDL